jgi:hypothetical protein
MLKKVLPTGQVLRGSFLFSTGELARRNVFAQGLAECTIREDEVLRSMGLRPFVREGDPRVKYFDVPYLPCCAGIPGSPCALPRTVPRGIGTHLIYLLGARLAVVGKRALITASATLCPSGLSLGSLRRTEGCWRDLDSFEDRRKHRPGFLAEKPLRRGRSIRTREEKVVHGCQARTLSRVSEPSQLVIAQ